MQEGTQALPDPDIYDKAIGLLQWTTQEIAVASASQAQQHDGFSLPSSFGSFHSDSLDAALRELESMQRSTSTERLHRLLTEAPTGEAGPATRTRSRSSASSRESALSLLGILSNTSSMAEALSVFLDTQFPGAKDIVDPDGLLGQSDIARLPSIHPRLSELEFLRDLRALEVQPGAAADAPREGEKMQNTRSGQEDHPDQHAQQDESRLTAELLRMLSAEHISSPADDTAIADRSQGSTGHMSASLEHVTPGEGARRSRRKTRHAQAARLNAPDPTLVLDDFSASPVSRAGAQKYPVASQQTLPGSSLSQETGPSMREQAPPKRAKRKRVRRSEDEDPAWQPEEASSDLAAGPEHAALAEGQSASASPAKSAAQEAAPQHIPRSRYKGVSCHKLTYRWEASLWLDGRQVYLGGFATEEEAARAYDLAALGCKGANAEINFRRADYIVTLTTDLARLSRDEVISYVRRRSNAFSRGKSQYRGVSGREGRWETRIGTFAGLKNVSFGVHDEEQRAARMYDRAIILEKGRAAKTNFPLGDYDREVAEVEAFVATRFGHLSPGALEEERRKVSMPLDEYIAASASPTTGTKKRKPRPRKVNAIYAVDLQAALLRPH
ncbi:hypothetical protein CVIRNUC_009759 [Coccomyxa viridis]|uniref:AP2/ERF domain-containing protein n=1 Tax=Coccomyxa viridis TaxID=1274662 RepID=A0AAV1IIS1_9CHLO|nr:hypothetical protein CVIRNUC_009759 [Coccomyxa viridis]